MDHFWLLVFSLLLWTPEVLSQGQPRLIGSDQPIVVALGGDVVLPCCVEPRINTKNPSIRWWRVGVQPDPADPQSENRYVHCYQNNQDEEDLKMFSYAGRTALFTEELKHGNASLKITNVKLSDQGVYICDFKSLRKTTAIRLVVESKSDEIWTTETPPTQTPTHETNVEGDQTQLILWICFVVFCVLLILILGAGVGYRLKHKCQKQNQQTYDIAPTQSESGLSALLKGTLAVVNGAESRSPSETPQLILVQHLERPVTLPVLHPPIRQAENHPNQNQPDFSQELEKT